MLDNATLFILSLILKLCPVGSGYGVLEVKDVILASPKSLSLTEEKISDSVKHLSGLGYINLRYLSSAEYCLIPTQKARSYQSDMNAQTKRDNKINFASFGWALFGGVLGGFLGAFLAVLMLIR